MTKQQIEWASKHAWFMYDNCNGSITVVEYDRAMWRTYHIFRDFAKLQEWAAGF